jgi:hypothetical protein
VEVGHYSDYEWVEYLQGRAGAQQSAMADHAESCETCRAWLTTCNDLMSVVRSNVDSTHISRLVHDTVARFTPGPDLSAVREVFAGLKFDTYVHTPMGVRSALVSERRLSFESDQFELEMTVEIVQRRLIRIIGHLLKKPGQTPASGVAAEITISGRTKYYGETDASGEFYFPLDQILTGDPLEVRFRVGDEVCLTALIPV